MFPQGGPVDDDARKPTLPAYLETEPDQFKSLADCSADEIEAQIASRAQQAQALLDEAIALRRYLDGDISIAEE